MIYSNEDFIIDLLTEGMLIDPERASATLMKVRAGGSKIKALVDAKLVTEEDVAQTVAYNSSMEYVDLSNFSVPGNLIGVMKHEDSKRYHAVPIGHDNQGRLQVAVADPLNFEALDSLPHVLSHDLEFVTTTPECIESIQAQLFAAVEGVSVGEGGARTGGDDESEAPVIRLVYMMLQEAYKARASDIHIEPLERDLRVRYRIDGVLHDIAHHPMRLHSAIMSRIKIMTGTMTVDEKRMPQDGRIQAKIQDKDLDLRVSSVPTNHGESIVMRILDKSGLSLGLSDLGFFSDDQTQMERLITLPDGIVLVTGPTGSGKTTTLYACLHTINLPDRKIITVEDPVEYELPGINQVMVKADIGMTFASALRAILRQAPNIIMIGEIRDLETASIAINASLTGHLVFSTLHTNDAPSAVARLADIGVKPFLISSSVRVMLAQRLARKLCENCKIRSQLAEHEMRSLNITEGMLAEATVMEGAGCPKCRQTGHRGRMAIIEIFEVDDQVRHMINQNLSTPQLRKRAREIGMRTLREDGIRKVLAGLTTASEVLKVTMTDAI